MRKTGSTSLFFSCVPQPKWYLLWLCLAPTPLPPLSKIQQMSFVLSGEVNHKGSVFLLVKHANVSFVTA